MVRHEAAEALGAIGDRVAMTTLERFVSDPEPVISESAKWPSTSWNTWHLITRLRCNGVNAT